MCRFLRELEWLLHCSNHERSVVKSMKISKLRIYKLVPMFEFLLPMNKDLHHLQQLHNCDASDEETMMFVES